MVKIGLYVRLHARPGKEQELATFLASAAPLANDEQGTIAWFAVQFDASTFAIFDVFGDEAGRNAHLSGRIAAALMAKAGELLAEPPRIEKHDVLAAKLPR
jgi:quinol monooxygenase YgiN